MMICMFFAASEILVGGGARAGRDSDPHRLRAKLSAGSNHIASVVLVPSANVHTLAAVACENLLASYDTEGNGEMTLGELAAAMGDIVGLTKEDVIPMFSQLARTEEVCFVRDCSSISPELDVGREWKENVHVPSRTVSWILCCCHLLRLRSPMIPRTEDRAFSPLTQNEMRFVDGRVVEDKQHSVRDVCLYVYSFYMS